MIVIGESFAHYRITGKLGAGGMGEVYRAEDTKLKREVAIKVLPEAFAQDEERMKRFEREAQTLASLNHPNIAAIYGLEEVDGVRALVLELVEGPTLVERIADGPMPVAEAVRIARQIAVGLEAAHEKSVIHRDLKPANVMLTKDGDIKILDFGLAKALEGETPDAASSNSPTLTRAATQAGVLLGTAAYMSPEQAKGKPVDRRTDIWAFGCVLYEMLTGRRAFEGEDLAETLAAVLKDDPDWSHLQTCPDSIQKLLRRCLTRDLRQRLQAIGEARIWIEHPETEPTPAPPRARTPGVLAAGIVALALVVGYWLPHGSATDGGDAFRFAVDAPTELEYVIRPERHNLALSPDGSLFAFVARGDGPPRIWVRAVDELEARPLEGTEGASSIFWSPDGESLAFFTGDVAQRTARLRRIPISGGAAQTICAARGANTGTWGRDGTILFTEVFFDEDGIFRVPSTGGEPERLNLVSEGAPLTESRWIHFLPDGDQFLVTSFSGGDGGIFVGSLDSDVATKVLDVASRVVYAPPGYILYFQDGNLMARRFEAENLTAVGEARVVMQHVPYHVSWWVPLAVSANGVVATRSGESDEELHWRDRAGRELGRLGEPVTYIGLRLSHDGRRAAVEVEDPTNGESDLWILETDRGVATRFTSEPNKESSPTWSRDDRLLAYERHGGKTIDAGLSVREVQGSAVVAHIPLREGVTFSVPQSWASDGALLVSVLQQSSGRNGYEIELWQVSDSDDVEFESLIASPFDERRAELSPDGSLLAFVSNESGRNEIYVSRFPPTGERVRVSELGGNRPRWTKGGRELVYQSGDGWLIAAPILSRAGLSVGPLERLMPTVQFWDVTADGERFLTAGGARWSDFPIVIAKGWMNKFDGERR